MKPISEDLIQLARDTINQLSEARLTPEEWETVETHLDALQDALRRATATPFAKRETHSQGCCPTCWG